MTKKTKHFFKKLKTWLKQSSPVKEHYLVQRVKLDKFELVPAQYYESFCLPKEIAEKEIEKNFRTREYFASRPKYFGSFR